MTEGLGQRSSPPRLPGKMPTPQMMLNLAGAGTPGDIQSPAMPPAWVSRLRIPLSPPTKEAAKRRLQLAERGGFEPPVLVYPIHSLSRRARSATPASLQGFLDYRSSPTGTRLLAGGHTLPSRWRHGGLAEWLMAPVLKTGDVQAFGGSNPSPSAKAKAPRAGPLLS